MGRRPRHHARPHRGRPDDDRLRRDQARRAHPRRVVRENRIRAEASPHGLARLRSGRGGCGRDRHAGAQEGPFPRHRRHRGGGGQARQGRLGGRRAALRGGDAQLPGPAAAHHHAAAHRAGHPSDGRAVRPAHRHLPLHLLGAQPRGRHPGGPVQPPPRHPRLAHRVVGRHLDDRSRRDLRAARRGARPHGYQRGLLHPRGPRADHRLPPGQDALAGDRHPHERHLPGPGARRCGRRGRAVRGLAHDVRRVRPHRRGLRARAHPFP